MPKLKTQSPKSTSKKSSQPRPEYPRPQFARSEWLNLNGPWDFEIDHADTGRERELLTKPFSQKITVPFCPESQLSGIHNVDFMPAVWYRKSITIPANWKNQKILLHFQAADYDTTVYAQQNNQPPREVARHRGGWVGFTADLSDVALPGKPLTITVRCRDNTKNPAPHGKQSQLYHNHGCHYTRTTGIWQTVWLEPVPRSHLLRARITPDLTTSSIRVEQPIANNLPGLKIRLTLKDKKGAVATATLPTNLDFTPAANLPIPESRQRLWSPEDPHLYDLLIELLDQNNKVIDTIKSYAGLRSVSIQGKAVLLNGKPLFQRLVLDQGYYPDGILTAPSDQALIDDIQISIDAGFNGARLHQKIFEERFLHHADKMGYLCWSEFGDWGISRENPTPSYVSQYLESVHRDYSHPSIVGWCPLNETAQNINDQIVPLSDLTLAMFLATKLADQSRPVLDASGYSHRVQNTDVYDSHDYDQNPTTFRERHAKTHENLPFINHNSENKKGERWSTDYHGQPYFCSEFGGIWWNPAAKPDEPSWGYGDRPKSLEEFYTRFEGLVAALLENPAHFGYCYTQLTDVFQEQNGIYLFNRNKKYDLKRIKSAQTKKAAIEN